MNDDHLVESEIYGQDSRLYLALAVVDLDWVIVPGEFCSDIFLWATALIFLVTRPHNLQPGSLGPLQPYSSMAQASVWDMTAYSAPVVLLMLSRRPSRQLEFCTFAFLNMVASRPRAGNDDMLQDSTRAWALGWYYARMTSGLLIGSINYNLLLPWSCGQCLWR